MRGCMLLALESGQFLLKHCDSLMNHCSQRMSFFSQINDKIVSVAKDFVWSSEQRQPVAEVYYTIKSSQIAKNTNRNYTLLLFFFQRQLCTVAKRIIAKIPTKSIKSEDSSDIDNDCCAICIEPYKVTDVIRVLPCR